MPDPKVLCRLVDLISTRISMSRDPITVVSRQVDTPSSRQNSNKQQCVELSIYMGIQLQLGLVYGVQRHFQQYLSYIVAVNYHAITTTTASNPMVYEHLENMVHVYTHISTQKNAAFDSNVLFSLFFSLNWNKNNVNQIDIIFMYWSILLSCVKKIIGFSYEK